MPDRVKPSFFVFLTSGHSDGTLTLSPEHQSAQMSEITNSGLTRSGTGCFIAVPYGNSGRLSVASRHLFTVLVLISLNCSFVLFVSRNMLAAVVVSHLSLVSACDGTYAERTTCYLPFHVCPSVTRLDQSNTVEVRIMQFSSYGSPIPPVFAGIRQLAFKF